MAPKTKKLLLIVAAFVAVGSIAQAFMPEEEPSTYTATETTAPAPTGFKFKNQSEFPAVRIKQVDTKYDHWKGQYETTLQVSNYGAEDFEIMQLSGDIYVKGKKSFTAITGGAMPAKAGQDSWTLSALIPEGKPDYLEVSIDKAASFFKKKK